MNLPPTQFDQHALEMQIEVAESDAFHGCGLSDVLYEKRVQAAYAQILEAAVDAHRAETEAVLRSRGFDPDFEPYISAPGECSLTGIEEDYCPCGRHE